MTGLLDRIGRTPAAAIALLAVYFAANVIVRHLQPASLEYDEAHQLFLAQWLFAGIDSQPPFYNWLQYGVVKALGSSLLALAGLKNVVLFSCYVLLFLSATRLLKDSALVVIATLGILAVPTISYETQRDLTHTVASLFATSLFFYCFVRTVQRPVLLNYALVGMAAGIGTISKYNFILFPLITVLALLPQKEFRQRLFDRRILLSAAIAAIVVLPHALWVFKNLAMATGRTVGKLTQGAAETWAVQVGQGVASMVDALAAITLPTLLLFLLVFGRDFLNAWRSGNEWTRLIERMFLWLVVILLAMVFFAGVSHIKSRWLIPYFFLLPLYLCLKVEAAGISYTAAPRRMVVLALVVMIAIPASLYMRSTSVGASEAYNKQHVPYGRAVREILTKSDVAPALIITPDSYLPGNIRLHMPDTPVVSVFYPASRTTYPFDAQHPWLAVWRNYDGTPAPEIPAHLKAGVESEARLEGAQWETGMVAVPYNYGRPGDLYSFSYAWIRPKP